LTEDGAVHEMGLKERLQSQPGTAVGPGGGPYGKFELKVDFLSCK
jgi:hypothetical protein